MLKTFSFAIGSGLVFGVISAFIGFIAAPAVGLVDEFVGNLAGAAWFFGIGYPIGPIIGLFLAKRFLHYRGSILGCVLSIILVSVFVFSIYYFTQMLIYEPRGRVLKGPAITAATVLYYFLGPPLLGTLGFHLRRKKDDDNREI